MHSLVWLGEKKVKYHFLLSFLFIHLNYFLCSEGFISANNSGTYKFGSTPTEKPGEIMASGLESSFQIGDHFFLLCFLSTDSKNLISCEIGAARKESRNEIEVPQKKPTVSEYNQTSRANSSGYFPFAFGSLFLSVLI